MKKISLFSLLTAALLCVGGVAVAQETTFSYAVTETVASKTDIPATGGTIVFGADKFETNSNLQQLGFKLDGDAAAGNSKYVQVKPNAAIAVGDQIVITCGGTSNGAAFAIYADQAQTAISEYITTAKNTIETNTYTVKEGDAIVGTNLFYITRSNKVSIYFFGVQIISAPAAANDADLKAITVNGEDLEGFDPETLAYEVELPYGTTAASVVAATAHSDKANVAITQAESTTGTATITVTAEDGETTKTYTIAFTVAATISHDATLASLAIDGKAISDFKADSLDYTYVIAYIDETVPQISAELNDNAATMEITQIASVPGIATVKVTAQDGENVNTYTVSITRANAIKHLTEVPFSNGAKGAINESALTVTAPYLAGTDEPTVVAASITVWGDETFTYNEGNSTITLTGIDKVSEDYAIETLALEAIDLGAEEITFDGTEAYIFALYGWDASKGVKFAKNVNEEGNLRISKGNTRIYMALPPAESVALTSGSGKNRAVVITINGVESDVKETAAQDAAITLPLNTTANNFICIESNQTSGDGGFTKMQLTNPSKPVATGMVQTENELRATKVVRNGQLFLILDGKTYTAQGIIVE